MRKDRAREAALLALTDCRQNGAWIDGALKRTLMHCSLDSRDAAFASRIAYGVIQNQIFLDRVLSRCVTQKIDKLEPLLLDILRIGAYQLYFMDRVPVHAAISETVELAKSHRLARAAGLVNAVLRNVDRKKSLPLSFSDEVDRLCVQTSHPRPLVERMIELLGPAEAEQFLTLNNGVAPTTIHVNTLQLDDAALVRRLEGEGVDITPHPWLSDCYFISGTGNMETLHPFNAGDFTVQDAAAYLTALAAAPQSGDNVIDVCAAPGGKSFAMAILMRNMGSILSCDMEEHKLRAMELGAKRLGIRIMTVRLADGRVRDESLVASADVVVCDVPCSGLGIIRKKPDIRYKAFESLSALPALQLQILDNASSYVKPGGILIYSTCTVLPEENEAVTNSFLSDHPEFCYDDFTLPGPIGYVNGHITLWPQCHGTDGFYISRMKRQ